MFLEERLKKKGNSRKKSEKKRKQTLKEPSTKNLGGKSRSAPKTKPLFIG